MTSPVQLYCTACNFYTTSIHKLQLHAASPQHDVSAKVHHQVALAEAAAGGDPARRYYYCTACQVALRSRQGVLEHAKSLAHVRHENWRLMQQQAGGGEGEATFMVRERQPHDNISFEDSQQTG